MGMHVANEFSENWQQIQPVQPNREHAGLVANGPVDFSAQAPAETKADVGIKVAASAPEVDAAHIAASSMTVGQTLREGMNPRVDSNATGPLTYGCSKVAELGMEAGSALLGAFTTKEPEPAMAPPPAPKHAVLGL